ncbi:MAG: peptidylprolyl isomerase [Candidatus Thermoplasmatota archaeon]
MMITGSIAGAALLVFNKDTKDEKLKDLFGKMRNKNNPIAFIETSKGTIKIELYQDLTPNTVKNFVKLANDGFYDGVVFHRIANINSGKPNTHIIQGGGFTPDGQGKESPYGTIDLEINEKVSHVDGAISMARRSSYEDSASSQFFICDGNHSFFDGNYAVFGKTIEGMEVVRSIALVETTTKYGKSDWPKEDVIIKSITIKNQ